MRFENWLILQETNLQDLYTSTVRAFPRTTKRQHAIDPVHVLELFYTPFVGVKTLFVKGRVFSEESGKEYNPIVLFKDVKFHALKEKKNWIQIEGKDGRNYIFEKIQSNDVLVRCNCADFQWRFNYFDHIDNSLYGRVRRKYEADFNPGSSNPLELPGMCKHLIKLTKTLGYVGILEE